MKGDAGWYYQSAGQNDWDLNAVVRYACGGRVSQPSSSDDPFASFLPPAVAPVQAPDVTTMGAGPSSLLPDLTPNYDDPLAVVDELSIAFFVTQSQLALQPPAPQPPPVAVETPVHPQQDDAAPVPPPVPQITVGQVERPRSKRQYVTKKKHAKKVVKKRVAVGAASEADPWAWRKYGQKTIKGSPYTRGYYRCSTAKECGARKIMELCPTDPDTLILTYSGADHNHPPPLHRNSLAGTTRNRQQRHLPSPPDQQAAHSQSPGPSTSPSTEMEMEDQDDDDVEMDDDLLTLLNEATDTGGADGEWR